MTNVQHMQSISQARTENCYTVCQQCEINADMSRSAVEDNMNHSC